MLSPIPIYASDGCSTCIFLFLAELSTEQILNLRRREALAYESDVFEQANKEKQSDVNRQEKLELQLRQLRKTLGHVKVTCEAATVDDWSKAFMYILVNDTFLVASVCLSPLLEFRIPE